MEAETLIVAVTDGVAEIRLNRPHKKNAITHEMWVGLAAELEALSDDPAVRAVVLCGAGGNFSAGADIGEFATLRGADNARDYEAANSAAFAAVRACRLPVIAAIRGICFGGGFGLAAAADIRLAARGAQFCVPAAKLGLAYPQDAMQDIVFSAGPQMARYLAFTGARIGAEEAAAAGFLLEAVADEELDARAAAIAKAIAANAPLSVRASKLSIRAVLSGEAADAEAAREAGAATFRSADYAEGRAAFAERRTPEFSGR
ncbi:MAG TPA: enoyl-CoA hydratase-related protein [Mesorhizobium sp.]|nr:enoyl-CoA hydratase-related protein [Mesorhizobium sp.]